MKTAVEMAGQIREGSTTSVEVLLSLLERVDTREETVGAWEFLDPDLALAQARACDERAPVGPLHGVPVGVKDVFDTVDMPTCYGSPIYLGHQPAWDGACVAALRAAGAVIMGKTVTTEFATYAPGKTANPHNPAHTPGGSSSGSAAAVADGMVPLALGTQTAGSVIRPASFCGVVGYKPTYGWISRAGLKLVAESLDTVGGFARTVADAALLVGVMAHLPELAVVERCDAPPRIGVCRTHQWPMAETSTITAFEEACGKLAGAGAELIELELPDSFRNLFAAQERVMARQAAQSLAYELAGHKEKLSEKLLELVRTGERCLVETYIADLEKADVARRMLPDLFSIADAVMVPSVMGEAPVGLDATGDPAFNRVWTLLHTPCVNIPAGRGPSGLPIGVQFVAPVGADGDALRIAQWAEGVLGIG